MDARYVCAPEAVWRILGFCLQEKSHAIIKLAVHLENEQLVYFTEGAEGNSLDETPDTTLTAWFKLNEDFPEARDKLYIDLPEHYVYDRSKKKWKPRERGHKTLSRMYFVSPRDSERYYLRMVLLKRTGAISFPDLKTVDGVEYRTFHEVARAMNLLEDDNEWDKALEEGYTFQMPREFRELFAYICVFGLPVSARDLYDKYKQELMEDYLRQYTEEQAESMMLEDLQQILQCEGKSLLDYQLPTPRVHVDRDNPSTAITTEEYRAQGETMAATLDETQQAVFHQIIDAVNNPKAGPNCFFVDGPGGSGTYIYLHKYLNTITICVIRS